jgi:MFS transporter, putative metabolite:H+ symporter
MFSQSIDLTIIMQLLIGAAASGRTALGFLYAIEFLTPEWHTIFGTVLMFFDSLSIVIVTTYYWAISNQYFYVTIIGPFIGLVGLIGMVFYLPESPLWLLKTNKGEEARLGITRIIRINGASV